MKIESNKIVVNHIVVESDESLILTVDVSKMHREMAVTYMESIMALAKTAFPSDRILVVHRELNYRRLPSNRLEW